MSGGPAHKPGQQERGLAKQGKPPGGRWGVGARHTIAPPVGGLSLYDTRGGLTGRVASGLPLYGPPPSLAGCREDVPLRNKDPTTPPGSLSPRITQEVNERRSAVASDIRGATSPVWFCFCPPPPGGGGGRRAAAAEIEGVGKKPTRERFLPPVQNRNSRVPAPCWPFHYAAGR